MVKILPLSMTNIANTSGSEVLDILHARSPYFEPYLFSNYLQIHFAINKVTGEQYINFIAPQYNECILLDYSRTHETDEIKNNITQWLKETILDEQYIFIDLNERWLPFSDAFEKRDFVHHHMVYGFSDEKECFYLRGTDKSRHLKSMEVAYRDIINAVTCREEFCELETLKLRVDAIYEVDWGYIYLDACRYTQRFIDGTRDVTVYLGTQLYPKFINLIDLIANDEYQTDSRPFALFRGHKNILVRYTAFFKKNGVRLDFDMEQTMQKIASMADINEKLFIKYMITKNDDNLKKIQQNLSEICDEEERMFPQIAEGLRRHLDEMKWEKPFWFNNKR